MNVERQQPEITGAATAVSEPALPRISVVTVVFNDAANLEQTVRSVARQSYSNIEYIVIDGGSSDGSVDIIRRHEQEIAFWTSEPDHGVYDAMNKGIAVASGDWITFLNSGDRYFDSEIISDIFAAGARAPFDFVYGDVFTIDRDGSYLRRERARMVSRLGLKSGLPAGHQTMFVRRNLCPRYDLRYRISSDLDWTMSIFFSARVRTFYFAPRPVVYYRVGGLSSLRTEGTWEAISIVRKYFGMVDWLLRAPLFLRWLIASYLKRAFGITTLKLLYARRKSRQSCA